MLQHLKIGERGGTSKGKQSFDHENRRKKKGGWWSESFKHNKFQKPGMSNILSDPGLHTDQGEQSLVRIRNQIIQYQLMNEQKAKIHIVLSTCQGVF